MYTYDMSQILFDLLQISLSFPVVAIVFYFARPIVWGAPYAPSDQSKIDRMLALAKVKSGDRALDIGSGDGRIVLALARRGADATGLEINPILCFVSNIRIRSSGFKSAHVYRKNFWRSDFSPYDVVVLFGVTYIMPALEKKLQKELRPGARVVSNYFTFPSWKPYREEKGVYVYTKL